MYTPTLKTKLLLVIHTIGVTGALRAAFSLLVDDQMLTWRPVQDGGRVRFVQELCYTAKLEQPNASVFWSTKANDVKPA
jgi:hypothetical protein